MMSQNEHKYSRIELEKRSTFQCTASFDEKIASFDTDQLFRSLCLREAYILPCHQDTTIFDQLFRLLVDPITTIAQPNVLPVNERYALVALVSYKPGVTDAVSRSLMDLYAEMADVPRTQKPSKRRSPEQRQPSGRQYCLRQRVYLLGLSHRGQATLDSYRSNDVDDMSIFDAVLKQSIYNPLVETCNILKRDDYRNYVETVLTSTLGPSYMTAGQVGRDLDQIGGAHTTDINVGTIDFDISDAQLCELSRSRHLALSLEEMRTIGRYVQENGVLRRTKGLGTSPTDVELECIAQTWSEHCKHKIFNACIDYHDESHGEALSISSLFKTYLVEPTRELMETRPWLKSIFHDNSGVVNVSSNWHIACKVETHNSPSALDPYGGAMTGIVGVNRDPFGTGLGAELLANTWAYCFAHPGDELEGAPYNSIYGAASDRGGLHQTPDQLRTATGLSAKTIREGVHDGVVDGGNQSGLPYMRGQEYFDDRFAAKPLVFCGSVARLPIAINGVPSETRTAISGDRVVMVGGRIGKDGIHGATMSSRELDGTSPMSAVQIGDPITQRKMFDMLIEARDLGLYRGLTDNGAGGLSSSVGEMATLSNGARLDITEAPLKYPGLMPWEILLSEAQERMTVAVPSASLAQFLALAKQRDVLATDLGEFTNSGFFEVIFEGKTVLYLALDWLHDGCPQLKLEAVWPKGTLATSIRPVSDPPFCQSIVDMMSRPNIAVSPERYRRYDHEVKGLSVIKPLIGVHRNVPADATAMRIDHDESSCIMLSDAYQPRLSDIDPGYMTDYVFDLAFRRLIASGAKRDQIAALDNFCWPDPVQSAGTPDGTLKLAGLVRSCRRLSEWIAAAGIPLISGKDSMKNDAVINGKKVSVPPTLLITMLGWVDSPEALCDLRFVSEGAGIYLVGDTSDCIWGSEYADSLGYDRSISQSLPTISLARSIAAATFIETVLSKRQSAKALQNLVEAVHAPCLGGIAVGLAKMAIGSGLGIRLGASSLTAPMLFSECLGQYLIVVPHQHEALFGEMASSVNSDVNISRIGESIAEPHLDFSQLGSLNKQERHVAIEVLEHRYTGLV